MKVKMTIDSNELKIGFPYLVYWEDEEYAGCIEHIDEDGIDINTFDNTGASVTIFIPKDEDVTFEPLKSPLPHVPDEAELEQLTKYIKGE